MWLENDLGDVNVACLASYGTAYMHEIHDEIIAAFDEIGIRDNLSKNEQVFLYRYVII